jgi:hypothetical protein
MIRRRQVEKPRAIRSGGTFAHSVLEEIAAWLTPIDVTMAADGDNFDDFARDGFIQMVASLV